MSSDRRAEARRQAREDRKRTRTVLVGDGIIATAVGHHYRATGGAEIPPKVPGRHRFIASAAYVITAEQAATAYDGDARHVLGPDQLINLAIGCWDCEEPLGVAGGITWDSPCPAPASD